MVMNIISHVIYLHSNEFVTSTPVAVESAEVQFVCLSLINEMNERQ